MKLRWYCFCFLLCFPIHAHAQAVASSDAAPAVDIPSLTWATDSAEPQRFVAAHGRRAAILGYPDGGLEIWAYPLQLLSNYQVSFREDGQLQPIDGLQVLRRVEYHPDEIVRIYVGPDFVVREHLFVPLDQPGVILTYEVEGRPKVNIEVHFQPSLDLMWPGALGGQSIGWDDSALGYVEHEPLYGYSATIASPDATAHDEIINRTIQLEQGVTMVLTPHATASGIKTAVLFAGFDPKGNEASTGFIHTLESQRLVLQNQFQEHVRQLLSTALQIETPNAELNRALTWAEIALDQAWVCSDALGCGEVAGYGPSRWGRRPQYDWFFAGDGLIAMQGLLSAGDYSRAREELAFITKYQNKDNGMIWHEMSQSAGLIDWQHKYPYMYVHVDITYQYLAALAVYVTTTGDKDFIVRNWSNIEAAYRYGRSLISADTGLPQIPPGKEGSNEQDRMRDDLGLSSEWISAADEFARLATLCGHDDEAKQARDAGNIARKAIATQGWDSARHYWLAGHTIAGKPMEDERPTPSRILSQHVFSQAQAEQVLDRIASPDFQTDWGSRSLSAKSADFDPSSYSKGSVSALASAGIAQTFWSEHRPLTAWAIYNSLLAWNTLDSLGHLHEVLAGDTFHPEIESVPEQTWSSAGYLTAAVDGLLGLTVDAENHHLTFTPHLPPDWNTVGIRNLRIGDDAIAVHITRDLHGVDLSVENPGAPLTIDFDPEVPLGAVLDGAAINGISVHAVSEMHAQDEHMHVHLDASHGATQCHIGYSGGVLIAPLATAPNIGDVSHNVKIIGAKLDQDTLTINAYATSQEDAVLKLSTQWTPSVTTGATLMPVGDNTYRVTFTVASSPEGKYVPVRAVIHLSRR